MKIKNIADVEELIVYKGYCVYFLVDKIGEILYIGKSDVSTVSRLAEHNRTKKFERIFLKQFDTKNEMDITEAKLIFDIRPPLNRRIEMRKELGLLSIKDIKKETGATRPVIKKSAKDNGIDIVKIYGVEYYPKTIINAILNYFENNKKTNKGKSRSQIR